MMQRAAVSFDRTLSMQNIDIQAPFAQLSIIYMIKRGPCLHAEADDARAERPKKRNSLENHDRGESTCRNYQNQSEPPGQWEQFYTLLPPCAACRTYTYSHAVANSSQSTAP